MISTRQMNKKTCEEHGPKKAARALDKRFVLQSQP